MRDYSKPPVDPKPTYKNRKCKDCGNTFKESAIFKISGEYFCTTCLIEKSKNY